MNMLAETELKDAKLDVQVIFPGFHTKSRVCILWMTARKAFRNT